MDFKSIFIKTDESSNEDQKTQMKENQTSVKFSSSQIENEIPKSKSKVETSTFDFGFGNTPTPQTIKTDFIVNKENVTQEQIDKAYEIYLNGFNSLNDVGYDFYEYYNMVVAGGIDNTPVYAMAFGMAKTLDPNITKTALITKADYYLGEINKVFNNYSTQGNLKKEQIVTKKADETKTLHNEIEMFKEQMESLKVQLLDRETKLNSIDSKYANEIADVEIKMSANSIAKDKLVGTIETVKSGIINNVK